MQGHRSWIPGASQKRICDFLLVINSNFDRISYCFRNFDTFSSIIACFPHPRCLNPLPLAE